jgi:hypothetical protein
MARSLSREDRKGLRQRSIGNLMPAELLPAEPKKEPETKAEPKPADVVKDKKPRKREKTPEELAKEKAGTKLSSRIEALRARALERNIEFPQDLEESLRKQATKGGICRAWRAYLQSRE